MANVNIKAATAAQNRLGNTPYGNLNALSYKVTTTSSGAVAGSDAVQTGTTAIGDVIRVGVLPAGQRLFDYTATIRTAMSASVTCSVGFAYCDGVDSTAVPQDAAYFAAAATALSSAAVQRKSTTTTAVTLPKDAYLTVTIAGAANAKASEIEFVVYSTTEGAA